MQENNLVIFLYITSPALHLFINVTYTKNNVTLIKAHVTKNKAKVSFITNRSLNNSYFCIRQKLGIRSSLHC
ncbi:hypothetical protein DXD55_14890 [Bacteroides stercoris]|nr:hypothetical protein DXD55_14890 [Bacteroides stercoris]